MMSSRSLHVVTGRNFITCPGGVAFHRMDGPHGVTQASIVGAHCHRARCHVNRPGEHLPICHTGDPVSLYPHPYPRHWLFPGFLALTLPGREAASGRDPRFPGGRGCGCLVGWGPLVCLLWRNISSSPSKCLSFWLKGSTDREPVWTVPLPDRGQTATNLGPLLGAWPRPRG